MARNTRNFWIKLNVDGRDKLIEAGPRRKDGGFSLEILIRENGSISSKRVRVNGHVHEDGTLRITAGRDDSSSFNETEIVRTER